MSKKIRKTNRKVKIDGHGGTSRGNCFATETREKKERRKG